MNISEEGDGDIQQENMWFATFYTLIFVFAVPANALALWAFSHQTSSSPFKVFLWNLSIADISYVLILPMRITYHLLGSHWPFGDILCRVAGFLFYLNMYCSLYLMSFISLDRLLAVLLPVKSQSVRKASYAKVVVCILWLTLIVPMSPLLFRRKSETTFNMTNTCSQLYLEAPTNKALVSSLVAFAIPLATIVVSYVMILWKLRSVKQTKENPVKGKAIKMIILILVIFLFAFVPYHVSRVIYILRNSHRHMTELLRRTNRITSSLTCISSVLDPVMYFFLSHAYRDRLMQFCGKKRRQSQYEGKSRHKSSDLISNV